MYVLMKERIDHARVRVLAQLVLDKDKATPALYGTEKFPESFLIDPEGNIRYYIISERQIWHSDEVRQCIEALMD